jgi:hypothetical protein
MGGMKRIMNLMRSSIGPLPLIAGLLLTFGTVGASWASCENEFQIRKADWNSEHCRLTIEGSGETSQTVTVVNVGNHGQVVGTDTVFRRWWELRKKNPESVPCRVRAEQSGGGVEEKTVEGAPPDCDSGS